MILDESLFEENKEFNLDEALGLTESIDNPYSLKLSPSERSTAIRLAKEGINKLDPEKEYSEQELFNAMDPENNYEEEEYFWYAMFYLLDKGSLIYIDGKYKKASLDEKLIQSSSKDALQKNIETEIKAGKDPKQAAAIAYSVQRKNK